VYARSIAIIAFVSFLTLAVIMWCVTKPRTRWLIERLFWVLFGVVFGVTMLLSVLSVYGER
jgi:uncharacterized membrane protein SirB2